jgi:Leucine-rich repeat (LRR) protein
MKLCLSYKNLTSLDEIELDNNLQQLDLGNNQIKEIGGLSCLTNLQELFLIGNQIEEIGGLSSLTNLRVLYLWDNQIKEIGFLASLTNIQCLHLDHNKLKEIGGLSSLTNLRELDLGYNQIKEIGGLYSLTNLQYLYLGDNQIPDWKEKRERLLKRNREIRWKVVKPQFIRYCFTLAPLNLPVDILIMIFDVNSYPNHLYKKWEIGKAIKDAYQKYKKK